MPRRPALDPTLNALRIAANRQGLSAYRLAKETGLSAVNIRHIFKGKSSPTLDSVNMIAQVLGMEVHVRVRR